MLTEDGPERIALPRDRDGAFEPVLIPKHARRFTGFDDKIIAMYARGMTNTMTMHSSSRTPIRDDECTVTESVHTHRILEEFIEECGRSPSDRRRG